MLGGFAGFGTVLGTVSFLGVSMIHFCGASTISFVGDTSTDDFLGIPANVFFFGDWFGVTSIGVLIGMELDIVEIFLLGDMRTSVGASDTCGEIGALFIGVDAFLGLTERFSVDLNGIKSGFTIPVLPSVLCLLYSYSEAWFARILNPLSESMCFVHSDFVKWGLVRDVICFWIWVLISL